MRNTALLVGATALLAAVLWSWTADGSAAAPPAFELVYERTVGGNQDLYAVGADGRERRLTDDAAVDALPRWTADGEAVVFTSDRGGSWQIYEVPASGGTARRVRSNAHREWQAEPSPNGKWVAFLSNQEGPEALFIVHRRTGEQRRLVVHGRRTGLGNPSWSADSARIVFSTNWAKGFGIHVVDVATGQEQPLTRAHKTGCEPRFHPDGKRILYVRRGGQSEQSRLVEHDLATGRETTLVGWPALNYNPAYSPDGSEIAFTSNVTGEWQVYRQRRQDGRSWRVTHGPGFARSPDYRPRR